MCRITVKVPPFWPDEPALWFAQLEAQFALAQITTDSTKFYHTISNLEYKYINEVKDIVTKPPTENKFESLKRELIARLSISREQRIRQLLAHEELGDRKPSQFLRHLRSLAGTEVPDEFIRSLWAGRLPGHVQAIIATQAENKLDSVALLADKINEVTPQQQVHQLAGQPPASISSNEIDELRHCVNDLAQQVAALTTSRADTRSRSRGRSPYWRDRPRSRSNSSGTCWYHRTFGNRATKCRPPCSFSSGNGRSSQ